MAMHLHPLVAKAFATAAPIPVQDVNRQIPAKTLSARSWTRMIKLTRSSGASDKGDARELGAVPQGHGRERHVAWSSKGF